MTLDEARNVLGLESGASHASVREAFRLRARHLHPDRHPGADREERHRLSREFDRAREARDILLLVQPKAAAAPATPSAAATSAASSYRSEPRAGTAHGASAPTAKPFAGSNRPPRTLRFDEFVRQSDAAGFGPGLRSRNYHDVARIIAWSTVGTVILGLAGYATLLSVTLV